LNTLLVWCFLLTVVLHRFGKWPRVKGRKSQFVEETRGWWTAQLWCKDDDKTRQPIDIHPHRVPLVDWPNNERRSSADNRNESVPLSQAISIETSCQSPCTGRVSTTDSWHLARWSPVDFPAAENGKFERENN